MDQLTMFSTREDALPLDRIEGLTHYLTENHNPPQRLSIPAYHSLSMAKRAQYDAQRLYHLSGDIIIRTPQLTSALQMVEAMIRNNERRNGDVRPGLIVSGDGATGKTTIMKSMMRFVYNAYSKQFPNLDKNRHPVVYIEVPTGSSAKSLMTAFARCLGMTVTKGELHESLMERVCHALKEARTELIIVDELQNLSPQNRGSGESIQTLRQMHSRVLAIFVLTGVNLKHSPLFTGPSGRQLSGRLPFLELTSFSRANREQQALWKSLVRAFERQIPLLAHEVGTLAEESAVLHGHTAGSISSLGKIFSSASKELIRAENPEGEYITLDRLLTQPLDMSAELSQTHRSSKRTGTPANPKATAPAPVTATASPGSEER